MPAPDEPRIPDGYLLTTLDYDVDESVDWAEHRHPEHELLWCERGMATVRAEGRVWAIPPSLAVWIPAGRAHAAGALGGSRIRASYFVPGAAELAGLPSEITGIAMTEPVRVLLQHNLQRTLDDAARLRLQRLVLDLLVPVPRESFDLVLPSSPHLRMVADAVLDDPADDRTTEHWASRCGLHPRTLARQFQSETGMSLTQWRILVRMQAALRELSAGAPVLAVARLVGYRSPSAFIAHFRDFTGQSPSEYLDRPRPGAV